MAPCLLCAQSERAKRACPQGTWPAADLCGKPRRELARFDVQRVIGRGYASRVYQCVDKVSGQEVALKVYHKANLCPLNFHQIKREMLIQSRLDHPNVLSIYAAFDDSENVYMVLEFAAKGDLYNYLRHKGRKLTEGQVSDHPCYSPLYIDPSILPCSSCPACTSTTRSAHHAMDTHGYPIIYLFYTS